MVTSCLVTGATGFLGTNLVLEIVKLGWKIRCFGKEGSETRYIKDLPNVEIVLDINCVEQVCEGVDFVFHVAGDTSFWNKKFSIQTRINTEGTDNVATSCLKKGVKRLIHTSTVDSLGYNPNGEANENWDDYNYANAGYNYADSKKEGERIALSYVEKGLEVVIIHPGSMIGPYDFTLQYGRLFIDLKEGNVPFCPPSTGGSSFASVINVAKAHLSAAKKGKNGGRYICAGVNISYRFNKLFSKFNIY